MTYFEEKSNAGFCKFFFQFPREAKNASSICLALKGSILIRNDSLTSNESKAKNCL